MKDNNNNGTRSPIIWYGDVTMSRHVTLIRSPPLVMQLLLLVLSLLVHTGVGQSTTPTLCDQQLHTYYQQFGLSPSYPVLPVINYTTGTLFDGTPYVTASYNMQLVANMYEANISNNTGPHINVVYISFDQPWCATDIQIRCFNYSQRAMGKVCNNILDIDTGPPSQIIGRFFVYVNESSPCNGIVNVTFMNTTLLAQNTSNIVYDGSGITNFTTLNFNDAQFKYRYGECLYSTGVNTTFLFLQAQFACTSRVIGCGVPRPSGQFPQRLPVPAPRYACLSSNVTYAGPNNTPTVHSQYIVWFVYSFQPPGGPEGLFRINQADPATIASYYAGTYNPFNDALCGFLDFLNFWLRLLNLKVFDTATCIKQILVPSTRRQFSRPKEFFGWNSFLMINAGSGASSTWLTTIISPVWPYSRDPIIQVVPCICQFSCDCLPNGELDLTNLYHFINPSNTRPLAAVFGQNVLTIPAGQPNISLNANVSRDPDNGPLGLSYYWKSYNITNYVLDPLSGLPIVPIVNVTAQQTYALTGALPNGFYVIILYVSDGQTLSFTTLNFTVQCNVITALAGNNFAVVLNKCTATQPPFCIPLNGSLTTQTANYTLSYQWTLLYGWPLGIVFSTVCNNYSQGLFQANESVACFIPRFLGVYQFQLTVRDNICAVSTSTIFVNVVDQGTNLTTVNNTFDTYPPLALTNPPIDRPVIGFPTTPSVPVTLAPFAPSSRTEVNTTVPPLVPVRSPLTTGQIISLLAMLLTAVVFLVMFFGLWIVLMPTNETNYLDRWRYFQH